jgi:UDP-N-acetylmuramoylalanine--D-glutamate ligase
MRALEGGAPCEESGTIARAVETAAAEGRAGDVVLLSPACASYDQFRNYEHRGEAFEALVLALPEAGG